MRLLAIETATDACSCALRVGDAVRVDHVIAPRRHAEMVLGAIDGLLRAAGVTARELDAIAFGRGPGSFTGVRIAAGVAQGLAFGARVPVAGVSTLRALAQGAHRERGAARVLAAFDARMGEVYFGAYEAGGDGLVHPLGDDVCCAPAAVAVPAGDGWLGAGEGFAAHAGALAARLGAALAARDPERLPHARDVLDLAAAAVEAGTLSPPHDAVPAYLRDRVATPRV